ncbi:MAG: bis(5'-nucleosyl)-tetraphosphatase (symmetrical) YqeK [Oscillospiraceae bacterium]|jgi:nicotinate-nucleotide adenylyltransferase|nr:bis(5'-nucleosyl)-tetraphosphatase (symmetrical) YqeK [Oscillospiraceae bacterium]
MTRIGVYGGSFNPPHLGHLKAAQFFRRSLALDEVLVVPAKQAPLRAAPMVSGEDRFALCGRTFPFPVSGVELRRPGVSYTADTLRELRGEYPGARFFLLVGEDQREKFRQWKDWREILRLAELCVLPRAGEGIEGFTPLDISSTALRLKLLLGEDCSAYLAPRALAYIAEKRLYQPMAPERLHHSRCVAEAAERLALRYGADPAKARLAGLAHDCAKSMPLDAQRRLCELNQKPLRPEDLAAPPVCHAFAGEAYLALECGVTDPEVLGAVRWHTLGHAGMTPLEECVYVGDLISADRSYPDVARVRALAAQDLHAASKYILEYIFAQRREKKDRPPHPDSLAWYDELAGGRNAAPAEGDI